MAGGAAGRDHEARGSWPRFGRGQWIVTGQGGSGHGCACLRAQVDVGTARIMTIEAARARPLATCRADRALRGREPIDPTR